MASGNFEFVNYCSGRAIKNKSLCSLISQRMIFFIIKKERLFNCGGINKGIIEIIAPVLEGYYVTSFEEKFVRIYMLIRIELHSNAPVNRVDSKMDN